MGLTSFSGAVTVRAVAKWLHVSESTVRRLVSEEAFPGAFPRVT